MRLRERLPSTLRILSAYLTRSDLRVGSWAIEQPSRSSSQISLANVLNASLGSSTRTAYATRLRALSSASYAEVAATASVNLR